MLIVAARLRAILAQGAAPRCGDTPVLPPVFLVSVVTSVVEVSGTCTTTHHVTWPALLRVTTCAKNSRQKWANISIPYYPKNNICCYLNSIGMKVNWITALSFWDCWVYLKNHQKVRHITMKQMDISIGVLLRTVVVWTVTLKESWTGMHYRYILYEGEGAETCGNLGCRLAWPIAGVRKV